MQNTNATIDTYRFSPVLTELAAGCDPDFDTAQDDLDHELSEMRLTSNECGCCNGEGEPA